ncbi:hypothetical protein [Protaetiibacter intestinalis]|uniref:Uncharacterized protein n=1 Tax=Protaetiibacter intestinalis TaxID=2419774 RepID=A0A387B0A1_9MICO|nr:hypothetical protein [Protaetiibacter intestinalis]AYF96894.1 hypothetical protein D7I47_00590 [Protaetiibacter intestinalis]
MSGVLALLIVALAASAATALVLAVVLLRRQGRLDVRRGIAAGSLAAVTCAAAVVGVAALQPAPLPAVQPVSAVTVADAPAPAPVDVQLPTLALDG